MKSFVKSLVPAWRVHRHTRRRFRDILYVMALLKRLEPSGKKYLQTALSDETSFLFENRFWDAVSARTGGDNSVLEEFVVEFFVSYEAHSSKASCFSQKGHSFDDIMSSVSVR